MSRYNFTDMHPLVDSVVWESKPKPVVLQSYDWFPWQQWEVKYPGKKPVFFERHAAAITFALYVVRNPQVMEKAPS